jgi:cation diffusion facilitator CzcD-associated flavoprotein CzcO
LTVPTCQVAIIGAGPYGLAAAAHLRSAGVEIKVFGEAMAFWRRQMPKGMLLISSWDASHIADPHRALTLDAYQAARNLRLPWPIPLDGFIRYGQWFQRRVVPDLDQRRVELMERNADGFQLTLEDGEPMRAQRVVIATGLASFASRPAQFAAVSPQLASHSSDHNDLAQFAGRRVMVLGAGQSALTSAALLHEAGADVEVIVRAPQVHWVQRKLHRYRALEPLRRMLYAPTDVGPAGLSRIVGTPGLFRRLPRELQRRIAARSTRPSGAPWLRPRLAGVPITTGRAVASARPAGARVQVSLDDGDERCVDHVVLATGYRIDVGRYPFLAPDLVAAVRQVDGYPELTTGFESSVGGLHFIGAPAALSFGPVMRFVSGTGYTVRALTRRVTGQAPAPVPLRWEAPLSVGVEGG